MGQQSAILLLLQSFPSKLYIQHKDQEIFRYSKTSWDEIKENFESWPWQYSQFSSDCVLFNFSQIPCQLLKYRWQSGCHEWRDPGTAFRDKIIEQKCKDPIWNWKWFVGKYRDFFDDDLIPNIARIANAVPFTLYSRVTMNDEIVVLNCQKCNQCLTGRKSLG